MDGRPGLETVDAAEGVENACWCIYAVNNKRACAYDASQEKLAVCSFFRLSSYRSYSRMRAPAVKMKKAATPKKKATIPCRRKRGERGVAGGAT